MTSAREREGSVSLLQQRHLGRRQPGVGVSQSRTQSSHRLAPRHLLHRQRVEQPSGELLEPRLQVRVCTSAFSTSDATMQRLYVRPHGLHTLMRPASRKAVLVDAVHWYVLCRQQYTALPACLPPAAEQPRARCALPCWPPAVAEPRCRARASGTSLAPHATRPLATRSPLSRRRRHHADKSAAAADDVERGTRFRPLSGN